jgi:hypothetical protein
MNTAWRVCLNLGAALAAFVILWAGALFVLYPNRIGSAGALATAVALDAVPAALHALALASVALTTRLAGFRIILAVALGVGLALVPEWMSGRAASAPAEAWMTVLPALGLTTLVHALRTAMLPAGDLLAAGGGTVKRLACLIVAAAAGQALTTWIDAGFHFVPADMGLALLREAPFVIAWMGVPAPVPASKGGD